MKNDLKVNLNGNTGLVQRTKYVTAKTLQLQGFGYPTLTEQEVNEQIDKILAGEKLTVIGMFMEDEVLKP